MKIPKIKIPKINMKATELIGALIREYDDDKSNQEIKEVIEMRILKSNGKIHPGLEWKNFTTMELLDQKWQNKRINPTFKKGE